MLAVHLDYSEENVKKVENFWQTDAMPKARGMTAFEIIEAAERGEIDLLIIAHTDPVYHLPDRTRVEKAFKKIPFIVEINAYNDSETSHFAHLQLPAAPWGEKEGVQTNMDRTVSKQEIMSRPLGESKPDWEIFAMIGRRLGFAGAFAFDSPKAVFREFQAMCRLSERGHLNLYDIDYDTLGEAPFRWGVDALKEGFYTPSKKAKLFFVENRRLHHKATKTHPYILLTGRIRDQWHSGTKTGHIDKLFTHKPGSFLEIHPDDAAKEGLKEGDLAAVVSENGMIILKSVITDTIRPGTLFVPVTDRRINFLTPSLLDAESKEPDYNHTPVAVKKLKN
jgi:predicted molibdopterin-dependent oxidoreductase YjgC